MFLKKIFTLTNLVLVTALTLSGIAAWYSILGLVAIFAAAAIPIIIMGGALEFAKVVTTIWLHRYWNKITWTMKFYLVPAVLTLALLTSMGIFGFLSKAHMDQSIVSGDSQAKLSLLDEKIKTQRDNIEIARKALQQMDAQVDARLSRGDSEQSAERAVQIRRQQAGERTRLQREIGDAQKEIARLNEDRAPIAAENRKIEAEVGPIKYIAALIYGDNPDANLLERAVRWVIILIVLVFDPLALTLVIAANSSKKWDNLENADKAATSINPDPIDVTIKPFISEEKEALADVVEKPVEGFTPWPTEWKESDFEEIHKEIFKEIEKEEQKAEQKTERKDIPHHPDTHPYLRKGFKYPDDWEFVKPLVYKPDPVTEPVSDEVVENIGKKLEIIQKLNAEPVTVEEEKSPEPLATETIIETEGVTKLNPVTDLGNGYVIYDDRSFSKEALKGLHPTLFTAKPDSVDSIGTNFGTDFPKIANKGDVFVRVDILPNKVFKFDGKRWIEINKNLSDAYLSNDSYIQFLINKLDSGEYDVELLTEQEKQQIEDFLSNQKN